MKSSFADKPVLPTRPAFQQHQYAFTATIRNPDKFPTPAGIEERRMNVYRELVYNNIEDLLAHFFPVLKHMLPELRWHSIVLDFVANHKCQTPVFMKLAEEFVGFLQSKYGVNPDVPGFLVELAHYEWVEIDLDIDSEEPQWHQINCKGDLASAAPYLSPLIRPLCYDYPVHRIGPDNSAAEPEATFLLVYRDLTDEVKFMELNPGSRHLLQQLRINGQSGTKHTGLGLLQRIADEIKHPDPDRVIAYGLQTLQEWYTRNIVLGTYK